MFADWKNDVTHVKKSFGELGKKYPKMLQAYGALMPLLRKAMYWMLKPVS